MIKTKVDINRVKIIVTIPNKNAEDIEKVRNAIFNAGAGMIGNYTCCSILTKCIGTFKPNDLAKPYIGENNKLEYTEEVKLETICETNNVRNVITEIKDAHPYEEPVIDIVPLLDENAFFNKKKLQNYCI